MPKTPPIRDAAKVERRHLATSEISRALIESLEATGDDEAVDRHWRLRNQLAQRGLTITFERDLRPDDALRAGVQASIEFIEQKAASLRTSGIAGGLDPSEAELLDLHISDIADSLRAMHLAAALNERNPKP